MANRTADARWASGNEGLGLAVPPRRDIALAVAVFAGYYLAAQLGLALTFAPLPVAALWPPNALLLAVLVLVPTHRWWIVAAAAAPAHFIAELQGGIPLAMAACWYVSNMMEAVVGAGLMRAFIGHPLWLDAPRKAVVFVLCCAAAALASSFLDSAFVILNGWGESSYWELWARRSAANLTASLAIVPLIVTLASGGLDAVRHATRAQVVEGGLLAAGLLAFSLLVFESRLDWPGPFAQLYLPLPFLLWAAMRFGPGGASLSFGAVALLAVFGASRGLGVFAGAAPLDNARAMQFFVITVGPTLLCLSAALEARRCVQVALAASDKRFRLVLEATRDCVYERTVSTDAMWWSEKGLAQFGYVGDARHPALAGWADLIHADDRARVLEQQQRAIELGGAPWAAEYRVRRADGAIAHVHEQGHVLRGPHGDAIETIVALNDVTESHEREELAARLAQASRLTAMGELAASIAHEINQPVAAIAGNVDAAGMALERHGTQELRDILDEIRRDSTRAAEIVRHFRRMAAKQRFAFERFDVNEVIGDVVRLVAPTARRRGVRIAATCAGAAAVLGDPIHVQQVLVNLILNGFDAMGDTPPEARLLQVSSAVAGPDCVEVSVTDHGHGIPPDKLATVFESFYTTKKDGMGLGLSISRSLILAQGGAIWAENNACGPGATFRFTLAMDDRGDRRP